MNKPEAIKLSKKFIDEILKKEDWYIRTKNKTKAIILYGSTARGTNTDNSDIDLLFFMPLEIEKSYTKGEYFYNYGEEEFNIVIRSIERLRFSAKNKYDEFQDNVFCGHEMLFSADDEVAMLISIIHSKKRDLVKSLDS